MIAVVVDLYPYENNLKEKQSKNQIPDQQVGELLRKRLTTTAAGEDLQVLQEILDHGVALQRK